MLACLTAYAATEAATRKLSLASMKNPYLKSSPSFITSSQPANTAIIRPDSVEYEKKKKKKKSYVLLTSQPPAHI